MQAMLREDKTAWDAEVRAKQDARTEESEATSCHY